MVEEEENGHGLRSSVSSLEGWGGGRGGAGIYSAAVFFVLFVLLQLQKWRRNEDQRTECCWEAVQLITSAGEGLQKGGESRSRSAGRFQSPPLTSPEQREEGGDLWTTSLCRDISRQNGTTFICAGSG